MDTQQPTHSRPEQRSDSYYDENWTTWHPMRTDRPSPVPLPLRPEDLIPDNPATSGRLGQLTPPLRSSPDPNMTWQTWHPSANDRPSPVLLPQRPEDLVQDISEALGLFGPRTPGPSETRNISPHVARPTRPELFVQETPIQPALFGPRAPAPQRRRPLPAPPVPPKPEQLILTETPVQPLLSGPRTPSGRPNQATNGWNGYPIQRTTEMDKMNTAWDNWRRK
ncbi:hypothetical protein EXIGLDRAFT_317158 [Exidia glandulosa HHB12029]|uniref:Uncharacterized protein n=1 Tax=Exidia glandulosa HHB12029 TaxID=1314781 RepID=A0A165CWP3_EXIGL|nr:hypothetical protein EXIGLDRAFT_317158 [Exidia glandulosa HHB12029]